MALTAGGFRQPACAPLSCSKSRDTKKDRVYSSSIPINFLPREKRGSFCYDAHRMRSALATRNPRRGQEKQNFRRHPAFPTARPFRQIPFRDYGSGSSDGQDPGEDDGGGGSSTGGGGGGSGETPENAQNTKFFTVFSSVVSVCMSFVCALSVGLIVSCASWCVPFGYLLLRLMCLWLSVFEDMIVNYSGRSSVVRDSRLQVMELARSCSCNSSSSSSSNSTTFVLL